MTAGTNPTATWALPLSTGPSVDDPTTYKGKIDGDAAVAQRVADDFAPHPAATPAMSVVVDPGFVASAGPAGLQTVIEIIAQTVAIAAAPSSPNNRIDLVVIDDATGIAAVIAGTPASVPVAPALAAGKRQVAQIAVPNGTTAIGDTNITDLRAVWQGLVPGVKWAVASGAADAITAAYTPANAALVDGLMLAFRGAGAANATTTPSFNPDGLGALTVTKKGGVALLAGDIPGLAECLVRYNAAYTRWELLNPAPAVPPVATRQTLTSGTSATYTTPAGARQLKVRMVGGGGGGGGAGLTTAPTGSTGGITTFNSVNAAGGEGGTGGNVSASGVGGAGGTGGSGSATDRYPGNGGGAGNGQANSVSNGQGGASPFFGGAPISTSAGSAGTGAAGAANTGAGGSGANGTFSSCFPGGGGGGAEVVDLIIDGPSSTYSFTVGSGGGGGIGTGTDAATGGAGGSGRIIVDEYY